MSEPKDLHIKILVILVIFTTPLIGLLSEVFYFCLIKKYFPYFLLSLFENRFNIASALLGYALGMFGIVATVITLVYGLSGRVGADTFLRHYGKVYTWMWSTALLFIIFTAFGALLSFATGKAIHNVWMLRITVYWFLVSFLQSLMVIWVGIMALKHADHAP